MTEVNLFKWDSSAAVLLGLAAFQLADTWTKTAPSLSEIRAAQPDGDPLAYAAMRQKLMDADMSVGTTAVVIGLVVSILTRDPSALVVMLLVFVALSGWQHAILTAPPLR